MRRPGCIALVFVAAAVALSFVGASAIGGPAVDDRAATTGTIQEDPEVDNTVTRIEVLENGSARWSVTIRTRLANESEVDDYEAFQERFRSDREAYLGRFERRMSGVVSNAANETDRNMTAKNFRAETSIQEVPRRWGAVTYSFTWTNFAAERDDALVVGDVFQGGLYLEDEDRFKLVAPSGYDATATTPSPDETEGSIRTWVGPHSFADERPEVRYEPAASVDGSGTDGTSDTNAGTDAESTSSTDGGDGGSTPGSNGGDRWSLRSALVGVALLAAVAIGLYAAWRGEHLRSLPIDTTRPADEVEEEREDDGEEPSETGSSAGKPDESGEEPPVPDLATDEDRVTALLEHNDGRMRQAAIADELEWSASKTSRVVSDMAEEGTVEKLRIGRENVIDLVEEPNRPAP